MRAMKVDNITVFVLEVLVLGGGGGGGLQMFPAQVFLQLEF